MPFLLGQTVQSPNANEGTTDLQKFLTDFLSGNNGGGLERLFPGTTVNPDDMAPYLAMFSQQNARNLGQAKESAGNLTGSGFANRMGNQVASQNATQDAFLANLFEGRRTQDADRMAQVLLGALNSNAGGVSTSYQPGFLDYGFQGLGAAAGMFAGGGGGGGGIPGAPNMGRNDLRPDVTGMGVG